MNHSTTGATAGNETFDSAETRRDILPADFLEWQSESRIALLRTVSSNGTNHVKSMPSHLPVMATVSEGGAINLANKGIGLLPKKNKLSELTSLFRETAMKAVDLPWESTLERRLSALLEFYGDAGNFDESKLGGLEIFEGATHSNLRRSPIASLLYSGEAPAFPSYQIDGLVEFVSSGDKYYDFLLAARELFARDGFHILQKNYPHGYVFHVQRITNKTPFSRMM